MTKEQQILLLIVKHDYKQPFLISNKRLSILDWILCININNNIYYSYMYKDLLKLNINKFFKDISIIP